MILMGESEVAKGGPDLVDSGDFIDDLDQAADGKSMSGSHFFWQLQDRHISQLKWAINWATFLDKAMWDVVPTLKKKT